MFLSTSRATNFKFVELVKLTSREYKRTIIVKPIDGGDWAENPCNSIKRK